MVFQSTSLLSYGKGNKDMKEDVKDALHCKSLEDMCFNTTNLL